MRGLLFAGLMLAWATAQATAADDKVEIKQRWIAGKQFVTSSQVTQKTSIDIAGNKLEQTTTTTIETSVTVKPHEDGKRKRLALKYDRVAMETAVNGQKLGYDSAKPQEGTDPLELGKTFGPIIGKEFKLLTDESDEITEVENSAEIIGRIGPADGETGMIAAQMFSSEALKTLITQGSLESYPEKAVTAGDSWPFSTKATIQHAGSVTIQGTYTFKGMVDHGGTRCAEIQVKGTINMELDPADKSGKTGLPMELVEGRLKGSVWFDPQLGMARDSELVEATTMSMKNAADGSGDIRVPMTQTSRTTLMKVVDVK